MEVMSVIRLLPASKSQQKDFTNQLLRAIQSGVVNPLEMEVYLKAMEDVVKIVRHDSGFKECLMDEVDKYPEKEFRVGNAVVVKSSRTTYDYSDDSVWADIKSKLTEREKMLKNIGQEMADPDSGEIIKPATRKQSDFLKIRFDDYND